MNTLLKLIAAVLLTVNTLTIHAQEAAYDFNIPAQPVSQVLEELTRQTGVESFYVSDSVKNINSPGIQGHYSVREALGKALEGTGLEYEFTGEKTIAVREASEDSVTQLPTIQVREEAVETYVVSDATTAMKSDSALIETPVSVQIVSRELLNDQKVTTIKDALAAVSASRPQTTLQNSAGFLLRGFSSTPYRDGQVPGGVRIGGAQSFDTSVIERIEVMKGPASMLYGRIEPGGLINIITKRPQSTPYHSVEIQGGSYEHYRLELDSTGPVTSDGNLLYRIAGAWQDSESFRDFRFTKSLTGLVALTWRMSGSTHLTVDLENSDFEYRSDRGVFALGDRPAPVPVTRSFGEPNDPIDTRNRTNLGIGLEHEFNEDWRISARVQKSDSQSMDFSIKPANLVTASTFLDSATTNRSYPRNIFFQEPKADTVSGNLDLSGHLKIGMLSHRVLLGIDYLRALGSYETHGNFLAPLAGRDIDIYNPVYGTVPESAYTAILSVNFNNNLSRFMDKWKGIYVQDHITYERWHLLIGGRYDWAETGRGLVNGNVGTFADAERALQSLIRKDDAFSPRLGLLYQWQPWLSSYLSWTRSFGANNGVSSTGESFDPEIGEQYETGLKSEFLDSRLMTTASLYRITKDNVLTADLSTPDPNDSATIGQIRNQGFEIEVVGQLTDAFSLSANYTYMDMEITIDNRGLQGHRIGNVPEHAASLWGKYTFAGGWSAGLGAIVVDQRAGDNDNTFILPGFTRIDSLIAYGWDMSGTRLTAQLTVRNLFDKSYYESTDPFSNAPPRVGIYPGELRTAILSVKAEF